MTTFDMARLLLSLALCGGGLSLQTASPTSTNSGAPACVVQLAGLEFNCPVGWNIVEEIDRGITIGDFDRPDKIGNLTIPAGRATLAIHPMPKLYRNLKAWVYAATRNAPEAVEKRETLTNSIVGPINVVYFLSPDSQHGLIYASYFFEIRGTPVNIELNYQKASSRASEYRAIPVKIIESLAPYPR